MRPCVTDRSPSVMKSVPSRANTSRPPKWARDANAGAWWKITSS